MSDNDKIKKLIAEILSEPKDYDWMEAGNNLLTFIDEIIQNEKTTLWLPKEFSNDGNNNHCILSAIFTVVKFIPNINKANESLSYYQLAYSRCCSFICQMLADRFQYVQKILIKNLFGTSYVCSILASDIYIFISRIIHPHNKTALCQIIMNLCKLAPPEALVKGAALINRFKHPNVNFENPKYQYLLDLSQ